jgi:integrase
VGKRRANNEGNLYQRSDGRWEARISYIDPITGQHRRMSLYASTQIVAAAKARKIRERLEADAPIRDSSDTVADWLAHWRETTLAVSDRKDSTKELYANLARKHLEPAPIGMIQLGKLRPSDVERLILDLKTKGLSDSTIRSIYVVLRAALDGAVRDQLLRRNPAAVVARPGVKRQEARHLGAEELCVLLKASESSRYHLPLLLIALTGLRRGEALALRWSDVDLDAGTMKITATVSRIGGQLVISEPKTERARRTIPLTPALVTMLKAHRKTQLEERLRAANIWHDHGLVFCTEFGTPVEPRSLLRVIEAAAKKANIEGVGVHTLRHSAATAWLEGGVHIKQVSTLLGHSSISITGDVYGHASDAGARRAVESLGHIFGI